MEMINLLRNENTCLEKFLELSDLQLAEVQSGAHSWEQFTKRRDDLFKTFQFFDRKVIEASQGLLDQFSTKEKFLQAYPEQALQLRELLDRKTELIHKVLRKDQDVVCALQDERRQLQADLLSSHKSIEMVSKFRSSWINESGENFDGIS